MSGIKVSSELEKKYEEIRKFQKFHERMNIDNHKYTERVVVVELGENSILPQRADPGAAGYDLFSLSDFTLEPTKRFCVSTGVKMVIPEGYYGRVAPRSGLAYNYGIDVLAGVIDSSYRGEIKVILINHGDKDFKIARGDKIAQIIFEKIITPKMIEGKVNDFESRRGCAGFGSTGKRMITTN